MSLPKQLAALERQGNWNRIIKEVTKLKEKALTPEIKLLLITAYLKANKPNDDALNNWAFMNLKLLSNEFYRSRDWIFDNAIVRMNLKQYGAALGFFYRLQKHFPKSINRDIKNKMEECRKQMAYPKFEKSFKERTVEAWEAFKGVEKEMLQILDTIKKEDQDELELFDLCSQTLGKAIDHCEFFPSKEGDQHVLEFCGQLNLIELFEGLYLKQHEPEEIKKVWDFHVGQKAVTFDTDENSPIHIFMYDYSVSPEETEIWITGNRDNVYTLDVTAQPLVQLAKEKEPFDCLAMINDIIAGTVGEPIYDKFLDVRNFLETPLAKAPFKPVAFRTYLKEHGLNSTASPESILEMLQSYTRIPKDTSAAFETRGDVQSGVSKCVKVIREYENGYDFYIDELEENGATAGYVCYRTDSFSEDSRIKDIAEFQKHIKKQIDEKLGKDTVFIIGEAHGTRMEYIDLIIWNTKEFLPAIKEIFKETPVSFAGFHVFRKKAPGIILKGEPVSNPANRFWVNEAVS